MDNIGGWIAVLWLGSGVVGIGVLLAKGKLRNFLGWWFIGFWGAIFLVIFGGAFLLLWGLLAQAPTKCPACRKDVDRQATKCPYCQSGLEPAAASIS